MPARVVAGVVAAACLALGIGVAAAARPAPDVASGPARHTGPQGRVPQFAVGCTYSHSGPDDPVVHPGHPGRSHRHDFYGATTTDAASTPDDLATASTTCDKPADTAAYWQPTLYDHGTIVEPERVTAYYRPAPGVDPRSVQPFPFGLALVTGDAAATERQAGEAAGWVCGGATAFHHEPPGCPPGAPLHMLLTFQDCWDGAHLDSADHRSHVAFSHDGRCPVSHPVPLPQLTVAVAFPIAGPGHDLELASGPVASVHGDFFNAWDPDGLAREVETCIHRGAVCDLG